MCRHASGFGWILLTGTLWTALAGCGEHSPAIGAHSPPTAGENLREERASVSPLSEDSRLPSQSDAPAGPLSAAGPAIDSQPLYATTVLPRDAEVTPQFVVAIETDSGRVRWKKPRLGMHSYSTPLLIDANGRQQLVSVSGGGVVAYEPQTGEELWWMQHEGHSVVPRPVFSHGLVFVCTGYHHPQLWAIVPADVESLHGTRELDSDSIAWEASRGTPLIASPLIVGDDMYLVTDSGVVTCRDVVTGAVRWQHRLQGRYFASPWLADGRVHFLNEDGICTIIEPGSSFSQLAENHLAGRTLATPAAAGRCLFVRSEHHLYCIADQSSAAGLTSTAGLATAADSPQFRGPDGQGHAAASGQPLSWSESHNIVWKSAVPGEGWSSPVVAGHQIWLATATDGGRSLQALCYDRQTGRLDQRIELFRKTDPGHVHLRNSHASATPVIDNGRIYMHFGAHGTAAVSADGEILWRTQIAYHHHHGPASSPVVAGDLLIINCDGHTEPYDFDLVQRMGPDYTGGPADRIGPQDTADPDEPE